MVRKYGARPCGLFVVDLHSSPFADHIDSPPCSQTGRDRKVSESFIFHAQWKIGLGRLVACVTLEFKQYNVQLALFVQGVTSIPESRV